MIYTLPNDSTICLARRFNKKRMAPIIATKVGTNPIQINLMKNLVVLPGSV